MDAVDLPARPSALRPPPPRPARTPIRPLTRPPAPALRPHIVNYTGFRTEFTVPRRRLELPTGLVTLVFTFSEGLWVARTGAGADPLGADGGGTGPTGDGLGAARLMPASRALISGPRSGPALGVHAGRVHGLEVNMSPLGAYRLFGIPMVHFEEARVDLAEVLGPDGRHLTERLGALGGWRERFDLLDSVFVARLERGPGVAPEVRGALAGLWADSGASLAGVTAGSGWSARTLRARFREQVGLSPKAVARVFRLQHALRRLAAGEAPARVAAACGYHDQAHLGRDVKAMTGLPPARFASLRGGLPAGSALDRTPGRITSVLL
ncbi:helix-turn-helix domain-containing protein [Streptomyces sp. NPDC048272]|uniref:helix-turn-helix domain-containing protein n=1 Tax=Streptomyces sp. NPDC048272 TaxID=3154616 RepID=UPI0034383298